MRNSTVNTDHISLSGIVMISLVELCHLYTVQFISEVNNVQIISTQELADPAMGLFTTM